MPKKLIIILGSFISIIIIALLLVKSIDQFKGLQQVWVAKVPITKGTKITENMIELKNIALNKVNTSNSKDRVSYYKDVFKNGEQKYILGKYAVNDFVAGEIILDQKLVKELNVGGGYMYELPKGYYAYPIPAGDEAKAGLIKTNDFIDLYVNQGDQGPIDEPALRHLKVYDLRTDKGSSISDNPKDSNGEVIPASYIILALNDFQIKKLEYYQIKKATITTAVRKRSKLDYEVYDNPDTTYPAYSTAQDVVVDENQDQKLIEVNKIKIQNERNQSDNTPVTQK